MIKGIKEEINSLFMRNSKIVIQSSLYIIGGLRKIRLMKVQKLGFKISFICYDRVLLEIFKKEYDKSFNYKFVI